MSSESEERLPEAEDLLKSLYNAKTFGDIYYLLGNIRNLMLRIIYSERDPATRCDTLVSFERLLDAIYMLLDAYLFAKRLSLPYSSDLRAKIMRSIRDIIDTYAVLTTGEESLAFAEHNFDDLLNLVRNDIINFYRDLEDYINALEKKKPAEF